MTTLEIVMPFYGDISYFKQAVHSVISQNNPSWRLTILDDNYPGSEPELFISAISDSRITYIKNQRNLGIGLNFQQAIEISSADYVSIIGCDDILLDNYVDLILRTAIQTPEASYIQPGVKVIDSDGNSYKPLGDRVKVWLRNRAIHKNYLDGEMLATSLLQGTWTYFPSIAWKTTVLKKHNFNSSYQIVLDLALQLEIALDNGSVCVQEEVGFLYRRHRKSASMDAARDASRFDEESSLFKEFETKSSALHWENADRAARLHLTSRLNALIESLNNIFSGRFNYGWKALNHAFKR